MRLLLGVAASACVLALAPQPASAQHSVRCSEEVEIVCTIYYATCRPPVHC